MKILFVLEHYYPYIGGAEKLFILLSEALAKSGHEVEVVTTLFDPSLPKSEVINGVKVYRVNCGNRFLFTLLSLPAIIKRGKHADLIHTTTYNAAVPAWIGAKICRRPVIVTFHELWGKLWKTLPFLSAIERTVFYQYEAFVRRLNFDQFVAVSKFTETALAEGGISKNKIRQIYNGLDYNQFKQYKHRPPSNFTYTYFGRLGVSKGLDLLLPAVQEFSKLKPESQLVLIIPKTPEKMYKRILGEIRNLGIQNQVRLRHELSREELYQQICNSSFVVIPSYSEGFCFVAAETVALGVPIISSDLGALREVVCGQMIRMESQSSKGLLRALEKAAAGDWEHRERKYFNMQDALSEYLKMYEEYEQKQSSIKAKKAI